MRDDPKGRPSLCAYGSLASPVAFSSSARIRDQRIDLVGQRTGHSGPGFVGTASLGALRFLTMVFNRDGDVWVEAPLPPSYIQRPTLSL